MRTSQELVERCRADGEFCLAARHWSGGLRLDFGGPVAAMTLEDGEPRDGDPGPGAEGVITLRAPDKTWEAMLSAEPPRFANDIAPARMPWACAAKVTSCSTGSTRRPSSGRWSCYGSGPRTREQDPAQRLRSGPPATSGAFRRPDRALRPPVELGGIDHRLYFEEAGSGIPLLLPAHRRAPTRSQWRHLFEVPEITDHFRLIAYDLPFHGKSLPPVGPQWWAEPYRLEGEFGCARSPWPWPTPSTSTSPCSWAARSVACWPSTWPLATATGSGPLISLEGSLKVEGDLALPPRVLAPPGVQRDQGQDDGGAHRPLLTPGLPQGDDPGLRLPAGRLPSSVTLWYYLEDYDLRDLASTIDTNQVAVHILTGHYDYSATVEQGRPGPRGHRRVHVHRDGGDRALPDVGEPRALPHLPASRCWSRYGINDRRSVHDVPAGHREDPVQRRRGARRPT